MSSTHCEINFDGNSMGVYYAGQTLSGNVTLTLDEPKSINDFKLVIKGCAEVKWTKKDNDNKTITYKGEEQLLRSEKYLVFKHGTDPIEIPAGTHIYNFACELPSTLASSFEGEYGFVRYTVSAILNRPWKFDKNYKVSFTVLSLVDLNLEFPLREAVKREQTETFWCWPCKLQDLYITVEMPVGGFVPGQKIPITITLNNESDVDVTGIKCKLFRKVYFISQSPRIDTKKAKTTAASVSETTDRTSKQCTLHLEVPPGAPSGKCSVITIKYELFVEIYVSFFHCNPEIKIPIIIGTVPFRQLGPASDITTTQPMNEGGFETQQPSVPFAGESSIDLPYYHPVPGVEMPSVQVEDEGGFENPFKVLPVALAEANSSAPPPSYEEATHGLTVQVNDDHNPIGTHHYTPRNPVYKIGWNL